MLHRGCQEREEVMNWRDKANEILDKTGKYRQDDDGWKQAKKAVGFPSLSQSTHFHSFTNQMSTWWIMVIMIVSVNGD